MLSPSNNFSTRILNFHDLELVPADSRFLLLHTPSTSLAPPTLVLLRFFETTTTTTITTISTISRPGSPVPPHAPPSMRAFARGGVLAAALLPFTHAAFVSFENCLPDSFINSTPEQLQFVPLFVEASFLGPDHSLNLTIYGNVSGQQFTGTYPPPSSDQWQDDDQPFGKIVNVTDGKIATLTADYEVATFTAYRNPGEPFCNTLINGECPLGPLFDANGSDPNALHAFFLSHDFGSSFSFSTISTTFHIISSDAAATNIGCISAQITPDLGSNISGLLTWLPAAILIIKAIATLMAAIWSPWGSSDIFRWSSNFGRDEDLLRLVTPGFGDCLQYIQWVVLTGSLTLQYPGFFRPAVSQTSWSILMFNESYVSGGDGYHALQDGLYNTNATYGMTRMSQLVGMERAQDIWACMAIWLLVIAGVLVLLCQLGFFGRWIYRTITNTTEEDLRQKNLPFTLGNLIRLLFNFFILPVVALSMYQLIVAPRSPVSVVVCAVILLVIMIVSAAWILRVIFATKPRTLLFDDMPTVLLYGPLYNTYSDSAAPFALIPVFITFVRGVAIGAVQPSGIAQIIVLAVCEVILILTLNGFKPFQGQTSMNLYHTVFAVVRLITLMMMIAFVPSLGVTEAPKGWIGYIILLLHAVVLVFGFFLNAAATIIEVAIRAMGAGGSSQSGVVRGSILNWRMLKKRQDRPDPGHRNSMMSSAAMLPASQADGMSQAYGARSRSVSASSAQLLNRMSGFENFSQPGESATTPDMGSDIPGDYGPSTKPVIFGKADGDNYYRPPRPRKATLDELNPGTKTRKVSGADVPYQDSPGHVREASYDSNPGHGSSPPPVHIRERQESVDESGNRTDYAVREVDQYYRGPALNDQATRKLKTGPADPTGPASTAQSWMQRLMFGLQGKKKDQSKGFEVVRSARMPPRQDAAPAADEGVEMQTTPAMRDVSYTDGAYKDMPESPGNELQTVAGAERNITPTGEQQPILESASRAPVGMYRPRIVSVGSSSRLQGSATSRGIAREAPERYDYQRSSVAGASTQDAPPRYVEPDNSMSANQFFGDLPEPTSEPYQRGTPPIGRSDTISHPVLQPISTEHAAAVGVVPTHQRRLSEATVESSINDGGYEEDESETQDRLRFSDLPIPTLAPIEPAGSIRLPSRFNSNASRFTDTTYDTAPSRYNSSATATAARTSEPPALPADSEWLRAVDGLDWDHTPSAPPPARRTPSVPRRSSRRQVSSEGGARSGQSFKHTFEGFDSTTYKGDMTEQESSVNGSASRDGVVDVGKAVRSTKVSTHRAVDSFTRNSIGVNAALRESHAEVEGGEN